MKCLLDRKEWKPKIHFIKEVIFFFEKKEVKMARRKKVMKVLRRKGTER